TAHHDLTTEVQGGRKLNCGGHHLWSHNWVGILGEIALTARDQARIDSLDIFPNIDTEEIKIVVALANDTGVKQSMRIDAACSSAAPPNVAQSAAWEIELTGENEQVIERSLRLEQTRLWDEFAPNLNDLTVTLTGPNIRDTRRVRFGMRELGTKGTQFAVNGQATFLRGTLENFIFPLTGHPPMEVASWRKLLATAKSYGLNLLRFHTCCPPEAAFIAADELGFYFQVELPGTSCPMTEEDPAVAEFLSAELAQILKWYGNHPSLLFVSMGNEQLIVGDQAFLARHGAVLENKVLFGQRSDPRHKYTSTTHPINTAGSDDFHVSSWPAEGPAGEPLCGIKWGGDRVINSSRFNTRPPETESDYREGIARLERPLITHEVGQWSVYPDLREIERYHGAEKPFNFEIIRERLREKGLLAWAADFTRASGRLSLLLYKEEIESALRTPGLAGFQLLGLTDYPGQGTSTVGILNALWESKGLTTPAEFRSFCAPAVPLARVTKRVWTTGETFTATVDFANYGPSDLSGETFWTLAMAGGQIIAQGTLGGSLAAKGRLTRLGEISVPLGAAPSPAKLILRAEMAGFANSWDLWNYPSALPGAIPEGVSIATRWDNAAKGVLRQGGTLLFFREAGQIREAVPGTFTTAFWNVQMKNRQISKTMGLLCDPAHPALAAFPTEFYANWQWWDIVMRSSAMHLAGLAPALTPIVRVVDSFVENRQLGMIFEARVGEGKLLVCSADITSDLENRPVARQLRHSLAEYAASPLFNPDIQLSEEELQTIFVEY
ncbi:MAG TPA: hypothetical protein VFW40_03975, partial [Capsulimonadaceae bacterium]|nr:hypothetical protein [Capsulimonadaceae bacterium]